MQPARPNRRHVAALFITIAVLLAASSLTMTQCRMVGDTLTGPGFLKTAEEECVKVCNQSHAALLAEEQNRHEANMQDCQAFPQPERASCLEAEEGRHSAEMKRLEKSKSDCEKACQHRQGSGDAG